MSQPAPVIYLLHGYDEYGIANYISELEKKVGEDSIASMNTTRLEGRSISLEQFEGAVLTLPFMVKRRLVVLDHPLVLAGEATREKYKGLLEKIPGSTALLLVELTDLADKKLYKKKPWLLQWAEENSPRVLVKHFKQLHGVGMVPWLLDQAKKKEGQISSQAATRLVEVVGDDPRMAMQELDKLLLYVQSARQVEVEDVSYLLPYAGKVDSFALINAVRERKSKLALQLLHRMLVNDDPIMIFFSIVNQLRQVLLARSILDEGGSQQDVIVALSGFRVHEYPARLAAEQAQKFSFAQLQEIFRRLLSLDASVKIGEMDAEVALEALVATLTLPPKAN